jgi:hypothetical protein
MEKPGIVSVTLADIYFQQGCIEQSMEIYKELMKKEPYNDFYKKKLSEMKKESKVKQKASVFKNR